ncbi:MAG TPA: nuclear transport factor 2 family protein [Sphingomonas sp.]|nr:nuclear transport factor 2 family protein [Sphingomonas sp.]
MKIQHGLLIAGSLLLAAGCSNDVAAPTPVETAPVDMAVAETEVRNFIEQYNADYGANDLDKYFASFAPDLTQWWPSGRVDLQTYETGWRKNVANGGGNAKVAVTDLRIQVDPTGDAAVATYVLEVTPRVKGEPQTTIERNQETDVLFKRDGQWKVVHVNYGPAADPKKPAN